jgi:RND superfamily putative drug exporter
VRPSRNIATRAGRWSAQHRKTAILGWIAFVVLAFVVGGRVGTQNLTQQESGVGDSGQAARIVDKAFPKSIHESVMVASPSMTSGDPRFRSAVADVVQRLQTTDGVTEVVGPYAEGGSVSADGHTALVSFEIPGDAADPGPTARSDAAIAAVKAAAAAHADLRIEQFGDASSGKEFEEIIQGDLRKAELTSLPLTLVILLIAFGSLLAAGIPVLLAITAVLATFGLVGPISQIAAVDSSIQNVVLLIGLAVGVDYSLFYLRRVREERAAGRDSGAAIEAAAATSGRAVLVSGVTVMTSMGGMYLAGAATFTSFATGTIVVVAIAMLGSLTVLPALLAGLGDRVDKGRVPGLGRLKRRMAEIGIWSRIVDRVLRRPLLSAVISGGLLLALAFPALHMHTGQPGTESLPKDLAIVQTFKRLQKAFPSETSEMQVVLHGANVTAPAVRRAMREFDAELAGRPALFPEQGTNVDVSPDETVATISFAVAGDGQDGRSDTALDELRADIVPETFGPLAGTQAYVAGGRASDRDFNDTMKSNLPYVFGFVLLAAFVLLLLTFRSIVVPIKAIVLNLLSVGAAYGAMVLVFQHGWFKSLLGFEATGPIVPWLPLFLFVVLFGLSMDYHVFILSRVREAFDRGMSTEDAVKDATKSTAGVVTSAAIVMVCVFAVFATLSLMDFKQMGVGLAVAVFVDATLIRGVLLPASMTLLGDLNWWLPKSLRWLPAITPEREVVAAHA